MIVRSVLHNVMCSLPSLHSFHRVHQESEPNMLVNPIPFSGTLLLVVKRLGRQWKNQRKSGKNGISISMAFSYSQCTNLHVNWCKWNKIASNKKTCKRQYSIQYIESIILYSHMHTCTVFFYHNLPVSHVKPSIAQAMPTSEACWIPTCWSPLKGDFRNPRNT